MQNQEFYGSIFDNFWQQIDRSALIEDENSMFGDAEVFDWLIKRLAPSHIIEIGSWKGHSANYMIDVCRAMGLNSKIICVDTFMGGPEHWLMPGSIETLHRRNGQPTIYNRFLGNTIARGNAGRVFPLCLDSGAASEVFRHYDFKADLIFVDGAHAYDDVVKDIMNYYRFLSEDGVMFGDDYQYEPLANAVHDCAARLGVQVMVAARKWVFVNPALVRRLLPEGFEMRESFAGWVHP